MVARTKMQTDEIAVYISTLLNAAYPYNNNIISGGESTTSLTQPCQTHIQTKKIKCCFKKKI